MFDMVAVPIYSYRDKPAAAISIFGPVDQISDSCINETILPLLRNATSEISFRLGSTVSTENKE